ncbi:MAG TPA: hypothetical protein VEH51_05465 [Burkholderiales bacterium]|nr:hypothetical protein [Burkholderiales bacterium]
MPKTLVRMVKLNGLQYNANRDPAVYRRAAGEAFRLQALLCGSGSAQCSVIDARGKMLASQTVQRPATFTCELKFDRPGSQVVTLEVRSGAVRFAQDLRLDVLAHAWVG